MLLAMEMTMTRMGGGEKQERSDDTNMTMVIGTKLGQGKAASKTFEQIAKQVRHNLATTKLRPARPDGRRRIDKYKSRYYM